MHVQQMWAIRERMVRAIGLNLAAQSMYTPTHVGSRKTLSLSC